jgi:hypothetical protein
MGREDSLKREAGKSQIRNPNKNPKSEPKAFRRSRSVIRHMMDLSALSEWLEASGFVWRLGF